MSDILNLNSKYTQKPLGNDSDTILLVDKWVVIASILGKFIDDSKIKIQYATY